MLNNHLLYKVDETIKQQKNMVRKEILCLMW